MIVGVGVGVGAGDDGGGDGVVEPQIAAVGAGGPIGVATGYTSSQLFPALGPLCSF